MAATLLLADDSVTIQRVIELTFASEPVRVVTVADGAAAIARIEAERPDIILADVALPGLDGYELAAKVKRSPVLAGIPVLLLTGAFEPVDEVRARQSGCDGVLVKPFEPQRLVATVKGLVTGQRPENLWPTDMPRIDPPPRPVPPAPVPSNVHRMPSAPQPQAARVSSPSSRADRMPPPQPAPAPAANIRNDEPGPLPPPTSVEAVFELGLDDLDMAFSRLDPSAPASRLDADTASDFQRDIQQLRGSGDAVEPPEPEAPPAFTPPAAPMPFEEVTPVDTHDLQWDLPAPSTVIHAIPLPASFPEPTDVPSAAEQVWPVRLALPEYAEAAAPPRQWDVPAEPEPEPVKVAAPVEEAKPAPAAPPPAAPPPTPVAAPTVAPGSLATAFSALLAAERQQPAGTQSATAPVSEAAVEEVVRRVVTRMTDEVVRKVVLETAERLIREEMDRLKI